MFKYFFSKVKKREVTTDAILVLSDLLKLSVSTDVVKTIERKLEDLIKEL